MNEQVGGIFAVVIWSGLDRGWFLYQFRILPEPQL